MFEFDLQLFFGGGPNAQQQHADQMAQQQGQNSNELFQQWVSTFFPQVQKQMGIDTGTLDGSNRTLIDAAQAPVNVQTARGINTIQNNPGIAVNPNAAIQDIIFGGQQNAGLAADQTLKFAMDNLTQLLNMGSNNAATGIQGQGAAANTEANLGQQINNQDNAWWQSLLGAAGTAAGMAGGHGGGGGAGAGAAAAALGEMLVGAGVDQKQLPSS